MFDDSSLLSPLFLCITFCTRLWNAHKVPGIVLDPEANMNGTWCLWQTIDSVGPVNEKTHHLDLPALQVMVDQVIWICCSDEDFQNYRQTRLDKFTKSTGILRSHLSAGEGAARDFQPYIWSCFSLHHREVWEEKWLMVISQLWMPRGRAWAAEDLQWSTAETILPSEWEPEGTHPPKMRN